MLQIDKFMSFCLQMKNDRNLRGKLKKYLNAREVCHIIGLSQRMLHYWCDEGIVTFKKEIGYKGKLFDFRDIIQIKTVKRLRDSGVSLFAIRKAIENIRQKRISSEPPLVNLTILTNGKMILICQKGVVLEAQSLQLRLFKWPFDKILMQTCKVVQLLEPLESLTIRGVFNSTKQGEK
jgi:DNA-binding transcriptional MerR regulator